MYFMKRKENNNLKFVGDADLRGIMWQHAERLFEFEDWKKAQKRIVLHECYQVLAILVYIDAFTHLRSLRDIFFRYGETTLLPTAITNQKLWVADESWLSFLDSPGQRNAFLEQQYLIKPYTFIEEKPSKRLEVPWNARLPFTDEHQEVGTGAFGKVSRVVVAGRHYMANNQRFEDVSPVK